jgi:hypothetical protein
MRVSHEVAKEIRDTNVEMMKMMKPWWWAWP